MKLLQLGKCHQKNSKRGGMLVIVLMIFCVSLILISSAMTITLSSRSRYYVDTERSQERLTLTCAAEAVVDAIESQEITDAQLQAMSSNPDKPYEITGATKTSVKEGAQADNGKNIAPGLSGATGNQTYMYVKPAGAGSKDIILDFSTKIVVTGDNDQAESLRVHMKYYPPAPTPKICENMVTCGEEGSYNDIPKLEVNGTKSFTVFHGDVELSSGSGSYIHNPTVITGTVKGGAGTIYHNDVIFYGPNAGCQLPSPGNGITIASGEGNFYFLGVDYGEYSGNINFFKNSSGQTVTAGSGNQMSMNMKADGAYFYNTNLSSTDWTMSGNIDNPSNSAGTTYWVVGSGSNVKRLNPNDGGNVILKAGGNVTVTNTEKNKVYNSVNEAPDAAKTAFNNLSKKGAQYLADEELKNAASRKIPTAAEQQAEYGSYANGELITGNSGIISKDGGKAYKINGGTYTKGRIDIDLSKGDASLYIAGDVTFQSFCIKVSNASSHKLVIILGYGVDVKFDGQPNFWETMSDGMPYAQGIISCDQRDGYDWSDPHNMSNLNAISGQEPAAIVIGLGKNTFDAGRAQVVDAYISLAGTGTDASTVSLKDNVHFYGRFEAVNVDTGNSDNLKMEYCPKLGEGDSTPKPLISAYKAESYEYHY